MTQQENQANQSTGNGGRVDTKDLEKKPYVPEKTAEPAFRAKETLILGATILVTLALIVGSHFSSKPNAATRPLEPKPSPTQNATGSSATTVPMTDLTHAAGQDLNDTFANPDTIDRTRKTDDPVSASTSASKLGDVKEFDSPATGSEETYYDSYGQDGGAQSPSKSEHDELSQSSLVFVSSPNQTATSERTGGMAPLGIGLSPGTRLRAHLAAAVTTAVQTPVIAIVDYNYVSNGAIVVPAGTKIFGRLDAADRSGYLSVRFESMLLPGGENVPIEAGATDMRLRPLKGKTQGSNMAKRILVTSATGIGEVAGTILGASSLNQPLSQTDLIRSRVAENVGTASDQEVSRLAVTEHIVVSLPANTQIYVILQKPAGDDVATKASSGASRGTQKSPSVADLQQLIQLQKELSEPASPSGSN